MSILDMQRRLQRKARFAVNKLFDYQVSGIEILKSKQRCILADDMGLGKTAEILFTVPSSNVLIVCPNTAISVWEDEIRKWLPSHITIDLSKEITGKADFTLINYESIICRKSTNGNNRLNKLSKIPWSAIVFDEAHRLKNRKSKTYQAALKICLTSKSPMVFPVTATPILNRPEELWPLLHIIHPTDFSSFWKWIAMYCRTAPSFWNPRAIVIGEIIDPERFKKDASPYILRRTKEEVWKDMPSRIYHNMYVDMVGIQLEKYKQMLHEMYIKLSNGKEIDAVNIISQMVRLKQITISHHLLDNASTSLEGVKLDALLDIVEGMGEQKAVIFSQYARAIERLKLPNMVSFTGDNSLIERQAAVKRFQEDDRIKILATTTSCGGQSITLTAGTIAIFLDLLWTPKLNSQAVDRLHRRGQTKSVTAINLIANNSIEGYILKVLKYKEDLFNAVIPQSVIAKSLVDYILTEGGNMR